MKKTLSISLKKNLGRFNLDVSLDVTEGITAIIGPSGAGKTSLLNLIAGLMPADEATLNLDGNDISTLPAHKRGMGYVFQEGLLFPHMSVEKNLRYGAKNLDKAAFDEIVELFDLNQLLDRAPHTLSGGEARRVAIARALFSQPDVLLLDEPLSGIDPARRQNFFPYLERLRKTAKMPVFYVSHQMDEVMRLADNVVVMDRGKVAISGKLEDIASEPAFTKLAGNNERSVVLSGKVIEDDNYICKLAVAGGNITLPHPHDDTTDRAVRVRIFARDVAIATKKPEDISVLNILKVSIEEIHHCTDIEVDLTLKLMDDTGESITGASIITSRITKSSCERLKLTANMQVWALIKAVAILN
ncbi:MAG: molybdenum ABC transporter ATP-binding protein [Sphingomonadales bacterium]|nr:molybdenum ABC transporter ATP-binding protein [Sphingomonadales bacterium]